MRVKRTIVTLWGVLCLVAGLMGCGSNAQTSSSTSDEPAAQVEESSVIVGGWEINTEAGTSVSGAYQTVFDNAMAELDGVDYEPVAVIGQQVVAGMNYAYLCKATPVVADPTTSWTIVVIYEDLGGKASFMSARDLVVGDVQTTSAQAGEAVGAWEGIENAVGLPLPADADAAFQEAAGARADADPVLMPVALLGSQVVAGSNYQVLCLGSDGSDAAAPAVPYVAVVYRNASGSSEITSLEPLNLTYYVTQ